jgi:hypothetical protein
MDPISNVDRFAVLLRQKLEERAKRQSIRTRGTPEAKPLQGREAIQAVTGRAARSGADKEVLERTLIEQLLVDQFGTALVNEPKFQDIINQVAKMMREDRALRFLIDGAITTLKDN